MKWVVVKIFGRFKKSRYDKSKRTKTNSLEKRHEPHQTMKSEPWDVRIKRNQSKNEEFKTCQSDKGLCRLL